MNSISNNLLGCSSRLLVVGPCGAGKSHFARALAELRCIPVIHLDQLYWQPGWRRLEEVEWLDRQQESLVQDQWIIDGTYANTLDLRLARAELVVHLDYPRWIFMPRLIKRISSNLKRVRSDMADKCHERIDFNFLAYAWSFPYEQRAHIIRAIETSGVPELRLERPKDAEYALRSICG